LRCLLEPFQLLLAVVERQGQQARTQQVFLLRRQVGDAEAGQQATQDRGVRVAAPTDQIKPLYDHQAVAMARSIKATEDRFPFFQSPVLSMLVLAAGVLGVLRVQGLEDHRALIDMTLQDTMLAGVSVCARIFCKALHRQTGHISVVVAAAHALRDQIPLEQVV